MRQLFQSALLGRHHRLLMVFSMLMMILLTFASQLEIVALGIICAKGPDFFELFAPIQEGKLEKTPEVGWESVKNRSVATGSNSHWQRDQGRYGPIPFGI